MNRATSRSTAKPGADARPGGSSPGGSAGADTGELPGLPALADALLSLTTRDDVVRYLRDLCTFAELEALTHRWAIARLVDQGTPYLEIAERVPTSTATVTRVAHWVRHGTGGYRTALDRVGGGR